MKHRIFRFALFAAALLFLAAPTFAADSKPAAAGDAKASGSTKAVETKAKKPAADANVKLVDINSAAKKELKTLPGVGDAEADKIIAGRPYLSKANLVSHNILPEGVYLGLKTRIIARQKPGAAAKSAKK